MEDKYAAMRADLSAKTMRELRAIARNEGICLGYDGATKRGTVDAIVGQRQYRENQRMKELWERANGLGGEYTERHELNLTSMVDKMVETLQDRMDEAALDRAAGKLAEFGYVKVVRCADCVHAHDKTDSGYWCNTVESRVQPDDYCSWGKRGSWRLEDEL